MPMGTMLGVCSGLRARARLIQGDDANRAYHVAVCCRTAGEDLRVDTIVCGFCSYKDVE